jgi:predicted amidohydrolase
VIKARSVIRIGAFQGPTEPGALEKNAHTALKVLAEAHRKDVDFACMPECFLSGYGPPDVLRAGAVSVRSVWFRGWVRQCNFADMVSIVGFMEKRGRKLLNSAAVIQRGRLLGVYHKSVAGSPFEGKAATFLSRFPVFRAHGVTFGVIICFEGTQIEPSLLLAERGARIIFEPHYSFIPMKQVDWHRARVRNHRIARAVENGVWYVKANTVTEPGRTMGDVEGFGYGDSFILDNIGRPRAEAGIFTTGWITADVPRKELTGQREFRVKLVPGATRRQVARLYLRARGFRK